MKALLILLSSSAGEDFVIGALTAIMFSSMLGLISWVRNRNRNKNKKVWQEIDKGIHERTNLDTEKDEPQYSSLKEELKAKCIPSNFTYPYDDQKVKVANKLYPQILSCSPDDETKLKELRDKAANELNITFLN